MANPFGREATRGSISLAYRVGIVIVLVFGWLTLNRVQFASKDIRVVLLPGRIFGLLTSENFDTKNWKITPGAIWPGVQGLSTSLNCDQTQATLLVEVQDRETAQVVIRLATQVPHFWHKAIKDDHGDPGRAPTKNTRSGEELPPDRHKSLQRSSLSSSQAHLEECSPPY